MKNLMLYEKFIQNNNTNESISILSGISILIIGYIGYKIYETIKNYREKEQHIIDMIEIRKGDGASIEEIMLLKKRLKKANLERVELEKELMLKEKIASDKIKDLTPDKKEELKEKGKKELAKLKEVA